MRYLAIDLGDKRTGLACGDAVTGIVTPIGTVETPVALDGGNALLAALERAILEQLGEARPGRPALGEVVMGLPANMDGTEGPRAKAARAFAARLEARTGRAIRFHDERLSSAAADWAMARTGLTRKQKKDRRDAVAAAAILRDFLDSLGSGKREMGEGES